MPDSLTDECPVIRHLPVCEPGNDERNKDCHTPIAGQAAGVSCPALNRDSQ